jgi:hypothetical protein
MVLLRSAALFSASTTNCLFIVFTDCLRSVYCFDGIYLVLCHQHYELTYNACLERFLHVGATYCLSDGG